MRLAAGYKKTTKIDPATLTFQALRIYVNDEVNRFSNSQFFKKLKNSWKN